MSTYVLKSGEREIQVMKPCMVMLLGPFIITCITCGLWLPVLVYKLFVLITTSYTLTNKRVIWEWGVLSKTSKESPLDKIQNVSHHQSLLGRLLGYGHFQLQTASELGVTVFKFIADPADFKNKIINQIDIFKEAESNKQTKNLESLINRNNKEKSTLSNDDYKMCPQCAENVKKAAKICRYCKYEFHPIKDVIEQD